jgi:hypothetical protein
MDPIRYEDRGPPNPRQAEVDRLRDAASRHGASARTASGGTGTPGPSSAGTEGAELESGQEQKR